ncbi:MAG: hypothetical protein K2Q32_00395 [Alphaproteobacteria bacterium]|nr:hypothetical protein [Alphaproteobacteria bacterium]
MKEVLIKIINRSAWWHVMPIDPNAYKKRGKFLASSYSQAQFYGRPNIESEKVNIKNPVFGFSEIEILLQLFEKADQTAALNLYNELIKSDSNTYKMRIELDSKMYVKAKKLGFDAIVLMTEAAKSALGRFRKPHSIELNLVSDFAAVA